MPIRNAFAFAIGLCAALSAPAPLTGEAPENPEEVSLGTGIASYYASSFVGRRTASGEIYSHVAYTAAHRTAAFGSMIRVHNLTNGKDVVVRVNDRGPHSKGRIIDLSFAAAKTIGLDRSGTARVSLTLLGR